MAVVVFSHPDWVARYPEFLTNGPAACTGYFDEACLYLDNTDTSPITNVAMRTTLLWMLTAHITQINGGVNGKPASPLIGRMTSASEGSVSTSVDAGSGGSTTQAWYMQTKYGASYWNATQRFRRTRYVVNARPLALPRYGLNPVP